MAPVILKNAYTAAEKMVDFFAGRENFSQRKACQEQAR
jgi:hypothetical protein